jgi:hypothetical protein
VRRRFHRWLLIVAFWIVVVIVAAYYQKVTPDRLLAWFFGL